MNILTGQALVSHSERIATTDQLLGECLIDAHPVTSSLQWNKLIAARDGHMLFQGTLVKQGLLARKAEVKLQSTKPHGSAEVRLRSYLVTTCHLYSFIVGISSLNWMSSYICTCQTWQTLYWVIVWRLFWMLQLPRIQMAPLTEVAL